MRFNRTQAGQIRNLPRAFGDQNFRSFYVRSDASPTEVRLRIMSSEVAP